MTIFVTSYNALLSRNLNFSQKSKRLNFQIVEVTPLYLMYDTFMVLALYYKKNSCTVLISSKNAFIVES